MKKDLIVLCILDGWGIGRPSKYNAIQNAHPEFYNSLLENFPHSQLETSGPAVGLPENQMGNSEVGHMTIGSGRVILQDLQKINKAIESGKIFDTKALQSLATKLQATGKACHLAGLISDGGIHSHIDHFIAIARFLGEKKIPTKLHLFTDGRDTLPKQAIEFVSQVSESLKEFESVKIATIAGRFYAMDRDNRTERTAAAYDVMTLGNNKTFKNPIDLIEKCYKEEITDEFIAPCSHESYEGVQNGDAIIFTNFRADRMRQICLAFSKNSDISEILTMTSYSKEIDCFAQSIFPQEKIKNILSEILSKNNLTQLRVGETEKYPHITFFFNAGTETPYEGEKRILIPSPKVRTYDEAPEMSAFEVTDSLLNAIKKDVFNFVVVNYANADMIGHTGNYNATVMAVKAIDKCLKKLFSTVVEEMDGTLLITADHGNAEYMYDEEQQSIHTAHTLNPVPFIVANKKLNKNSIVLGNGTLADIAPTILNIYNIPAPTEMSGHNLIKAK